MSTPILLGLLFSALLHASWNALIKAGPDKVRDSVLISAFAALISAIILPFLAMPDAASWPFILASATIHVAYYSLVGLAYRQGDMSYAYPLMRGLPPLLVALVSGKAPVAEVAALRETAILFGTAISALVLKEKIGWNRAVAAAMVTLGAILLRLA